MEVHAHTHTPRKKWTHYFWEFLMLFLAVFCGFLAEYQLEHKIERDRARIYADLLKDDFKMDTAQLNSLITGKEQNDKAKKIQEKIWQTPIEKVTLAYIEPPEFGLDITSFFWNDASYSQMKSSGNLRILKNKELLRKLGAYETFIKQIRFVDDRKMVFFSSEHLFKRKVNEEKFRLQHTHINDSISLKSQGFDFDGWIEANMVGKEMFFYEEWLRELYPLLKKQAEEIIDLLNKEYHLK